jgi:hypothetical protein
VNLLSPLPVHGGAGDVILSASGNAADANRVIVIVQGVPERAGVWSNTLVALGRTEEASMDRHVAAFAARGWGTLVVDPHRDPEAFPPAAYAAHLGAACRAIGGRPAAAVVFSMGAQALFDFVVDEPIAARPLRGAVLLEPILAWTSPDDVPAEIRRWVARCTLHLAAERDTVHDVGDPERVLDMAATRHRADLHGALPAVALDAIVTDLERLLGAEV